MKLRCVRCGRQWGVSVKKEIPLGGYICPWCTIKRDAPFAFALICLAIACSLDLDKLDPLSGLGIGLLLMVGMAGGFYVGRGFWGQTHDS